MEDNNQLTFDFMVNHWLLWHFAQQPREIKVRAMVALGLRPSMRSAMKCSTANLDRALATYFRNLVSP